MKNKVLIKEKLLKSGLSLGCYDAKIDRLSKEDVRKILDNIEFGSTDISVGRHIVEVFHVDSEVDLSLTNSKDYAKTYGRIFADTH